MKLTALLVLGCTCASLANDDGIWPRTPQDLQAEAWARREKGQEQMWSAGMVARIKQALDAGRNPKNLEQCTRQGGGTFPMDPHSGECKRDSALASRAQPAAAPHGAGAGAGAAAHGAARLRVDVFVMAGCPWCALQLAYLKPYLQGMWDLVDFRLWSLVSRRPALDWYMDPEQQKAVAEDSWGGFTSTERYAGFESLNGRADLQGDAWELCAQKYYGRRPPERPWPRYMDFVECMASNYNRVGVGLARECASWAGIDFDGVLDRCARRSSEGRGLLLHSLRAARAARVRSAPTTILGGLRFAAAAAGGRQHAAEAAEVAEERKHARTASVMPDLQSPSRLNSGLCVRLACMLALGDLVPATPSAAEAAKPRAAKYEELGGARDRFIRAAGASGGTAVVVAPPTVRARHLALGADGAAFTFGSWLRSVRGGTLLARFVPGRASSGSGPLPPCANATARPHSWQRAGRAAAGRDDDWDDDDGTPAEARPAEARAPPVPKAMRIDPDLALYVAPDATLWMTVGRGSTAVRLSALQSEPPHGRVANRCGGGCDDVGGSPQWGLSDAFWRESGRSGACHTTGVGGKPHGSASNSSAPRPACVFPFLANGKWRSSCTRARVAPGQRAGGSGSAHAGHGTGSGVRARAGLVSVEHTLADLFEGARGEGAHPQVGKGVLGKLGFRGAGPATGGAAAAEDEGLVPPPGAAERPAELHAVHGWPWCATQVSAVGAKHGAKKAGAGHVLQWGWCDTGTDTMLLDGRWHHVALACGAARQDCHGAAECSLFVDGAQRARGLLPLRRPGGAGPAPRRRRDTGPPGAVEKRRRRRRHGKGSKAAAKPAKRRARHQRLWAPEQRSRLQFGLSDDNSGWPEWPPARISAVRHPAWNPALSGELSRSRYWRGEALTVAEVLHVVASSSPDATSNARAPELAVPLPAALAKVAAAHGNAARPIDRFGVPMPAAADGGGASAAADAALRARQRDGGLALGTSTGGLHLGREMMDELPRVWQPLLRLFSAMSLLAALLLMVAPPETDDEAGAGGAEAGAAVAPGEDSWLDAEQIAIMQSQTEVAGEATEGDGIEAGAPGAPGAADGYGTTGGGGDSSNDAVGGNAAAGLAEEMNAYEAEAEVPGGDHIEMEEIGRSTT